MNFVCNDELKLTLRRRLSAFERRDPVASGRAAAVALPVLAHGFGSGVPGMASYCEWQHDAALLLTRRSSKLRDHPGQWALPGGRVDEGETVEVAALRELQEEVGIKLEPSAILGRLDNFVTKSGFAISAVVVWVGTDLEPTPNPDEVERVHRIPFDEFLRVDAPVLDSDEGDVHPVLRMPVGDTWIAAPTAALLYQFREVCLLGRPTRVAHFEQPRFAWR